MNEMLEVKTMIDLAGPKSFSIIDELGRGTSTTDGLGIAWSVCEYFSKN